MSIKSTVLSLKVSMSHSQAPYKVIVLLIVMLSVNIRAESSTLDSCSKSYSQADRNFNKLPSLKNQQDFLFLENQLNEYMHTLQLDSITVKPRDLDNLKLRFKNLSLKDQKKILDIISKTYLHVKIFKYSDILPIKKLKRQFDLLLTLTTDSFSFFNERVVKQLKSVESTLQEYYKLMAQKINLSRETDVDNVLYVAYRLQEQLQQNPKFQNEKIYLYGSFVNGKSISILSDLDYAVSNPHLAAKLENLNIQFRDLYQFELTDVQGHMAKKSLIHQYGYLNPIVFVVHANTIEIRVYKTQPFKETQDNPYFLSLFI
ncbi:MAG: hypothetical protein KDD45_10890 [Bdellovibrionales bacterium]|nr:hypothetical protein [Bdellovibrionales bacterium]